MEAKLGDKQIYTIGSSFCLHLIICITLPWISDLFWEQHHEIIPMDAYPHAEEVDKELPQYIPPENVLELGNNQTVRVKLTRDNYKERMHYLLYLEEHEHKKIMSRYPNLYINMHVLSISSKNFPHVQLFWRRECMFTFLLTIIINFMHQCLIHVESPCIPPSWPLRVLLVALIPYVKLILSLTTKVIIIFNSFQGQGIPAPPPPTPIFILDHTA